MDAADALGADLRATGLLERVDLQPTVWSLVLTPADPTCLFVLRTALHHAVYSSTGDKANVVLPSEYVAPRECGGQGERLVKDLCGKTIEFLHGASRGLVGGRAHLH
jgi:hypothetical protein